MIVIISNTSIHISIIITSNNMFIIMWLPRAPSSHLVVRVAEGLQNLCGTPGGMPACNVSCCNVNYCKNKSNVIVAVC